MSCTFVTCLHFQSERSSSPRTMSSPLQKLESYWSALVDDNTEQLADIRDESDPELALDLLDALNAARLTIRDDTTVFGKDEVTPFQLSSDRSDALKVGTQIDGYVLTEFLGRGGMAVVYAAEPVSYTHLTLPTIYSV